jgi:hypothetical protein
MKSHQKNKQSILSFGITKYTFPVIVTSKKSDLNIRLEVIQQDSEVPGKLTARCSVKFGFSVSQYSYVD